MQPLKIIRNGTGLSFTIFSNNAPPGKTHYHLNFNEIVRHFSLGINQNYILMHYNKFEKKWGFVKARTRDYALVDEQSLAIPAIPQFLLLPSTHSPTTLIRGVLLYDDSPTNESMMPPKEIEYQH